MREHAARCVPREVGGQYLVAAAGGSLRQPPLRKGIETAACLKIVRDDRDITVSSDFSLNHSKARVIVRTYDLDAIEGAACFP